MDAGQLVMFESPYCDSCPAGQACHEQVTAQGCSPLGPPHPNVLHPAQPDWLGRFAEVNGPGLEAVQAASQVLPDLPKYIPRSRLGASIQNKREIPALAVSLREVERLATWVRRQGMSAKALLGLSEDALLVVLGFESDAYLERAWPKPRRRQLIEAILQVRPDLAVAWGYSVWYRHTRGWTYPRVEQLLNMKRSLITYADLQRAGIPAAPHVYWGNRDDLRRWCRWLTDNPAVSTIAVDLQTADSVGDWRGALDGLASLHQNLGNRVRILINGPCQPARIRQIAAIWPGCSLSSFGAYFRTTFPKKPLYGLRSVWDGDGAVDRQAIFAGAVREYDELVSGAGQPITSCLPRIHDTCPTRGFAREGDLSWPGGTYLGGGIVQLGLPLVGAAAATASGVL